MSQYYLGRKLQIPTPPGARTHVYFYEPSMVRRPDDVSPALFRLQNMQRAHGWMAPDVKPVGPHHNFMPIAYTSPTEAARLNPRQHVVKFMDGVWVAKGTKFERRSWEW